MEHVYPTLLSPILRRGFYIRNRMGASRAYPPFSAGVAAKKPLTSSIPFTASFAKNGAAIVTCAAPDGIPGTAELAADRFRRCLRRRSSKMCPIISEHWTYRLPPAP